jgi:hypothetical protein
LATTRALERRLQEQEAELERALQGAREEATGQAEARAQIAVQAEQQKAERLGERVRVLEKERGEERRFVESYRRERDAAEAARREVGLVNLTTSCCLLFAVCVSFPSFQFRFYFFCWLG